MPTAPCPNCGKVLDAATNVSNDGQAEPGDISICLYCGHINAFADDLTLRNLTDAEMTMIAGDPLIIAVQNMRAEVIKKKPGDT